MILVKTGMWIYPFFFPKDSEEKIYFNLHTDKHEYNWEVVCVRDPLTINHIWANFKLVL